MLLKRLRCQVAVSSALVQHTLKVLVGGISRQEQNHAVHLMKSHSYDPFAPRSTDYYLKQALDPTGDNENSQFRAIWMIELFCTISSASTHYYHTAPRNMAIFRLMIMCDIFSRFLSQIKSLVGLGYAARQCCFCFGKLAVKINFVVICLFRGLSQFLGFRDVELNWK